MRLNLWLCEVTLFLKIEWPELVRSDGLLTTAEDGYTLFLRVHRYFTIEPLLMKPLLKPACQVTRGGKSVKLAFYSIFRSQKQSVCYVQAGPCLVFL